MANLEELKLSQSKIALMLNNSLKNKSKDPFDTLKDLNLSQSEKLAILTILDPAIISELSDDIFDVITPKELQILDLLSAREEKSEVVFAEAVRITYESKTGESIIEKIERITEKILLLIASVIKELQYMILRSSKNGVFDEKSFAQSALLFLREKSK